MQSVLDWVDEYGAVVIALIAIIGSCAIGIYVSFAR